MWLCILSGRQFEETHENAQWGKSNKCNKCDFASSRTHMLYQNPEKYRYLFSKIPVSVFESNPGIPKGPAGEVKWRCADWRWFKCPFVISTGGTRWRSQGRQDDWTWGPPLLQGQNWGNLNWSWKKGCNLIWTKIGARFGKKPVFISILFRSLVNHQWW